MNKLDSRKAQLFDSKSPVPLGNYQTRGSKNRRVFVRKLAGPLSLLLLTAVAVVPGANGQQSLPASGSQDQLSFEAPASNIWEHAVGEGFRSTAQSISLSAGATYGIAAFGTLEKHDLAMVSFSYGHMLGRTLGEGHWYRGNPELRFELFTGAQFSPSTEWFVGLTPHLRYNFATGSRWIPFADIGAGVTATSIGPPDLSGTFEFNLQGGGGLQWFLKDDLSITVEARYVHWSCAGINKPNLGLNGVTGMLGLTFYY